MNNRSRKWKTWEKAIFAASLLVIFGAVIFSVSPERLAWQGPLVMGTLSMPKPNPSHILLRDPRPNSDSMFSLLGFISVMGILALGGRWLLGKSAVSPTGKPNNTKELPHFFFF